MAPQISDNFQFGSTVQKVQNWSILYEFEFN